MILGYLFLYFIQIYLKKYLNLAESSGHMMISTKRPTVADARKITLFRNIPRENHVTCRFPYRQQIHVYYLQTDFLIPAGCIQQETIVDLAAYKTSM